MIDFAPRFLRPRRLPAVRTAPARATESFAVPMALVILAPTAKSPNAVSALTPLTPVKRASDSA
jgi:hypothetical protein